MITYFANHTWDGSSSWRSKVQQETSSSHQTELILPNGDTLLQHNSGSRMTHLQNSLCDYTRGLFIIGYVGICLMFDYFTLSIGSIRKSLNRYHCWCVTPWKQDRKHSLSLMSNIFGQKSSKYFKDSLKPLSFDGRSRLLWYVQPGFLRSEHPGYEIRWQPGHRQTLLLPLHFQSAMRRNETQFIWARSLKEIESHLSQIWQILMWLMKLTLWNSEKMFLTSSPSDRLLTSRPWALLMHIFRLRGIHTCLMSSAWVSKVKPSTLHSSSLYKIYIYYYYFK